MWIIKKIILTLVIIFVLYIIWLFAFTDQTRGFWDSIWLKSFNDFVLDFKKKLDNTSVNTDFNFKDIQSGASDMIDSASDSLKGIKSKIDSVRSTASWVEKTYNEVKTQVEETKKNIQDVNDKFNNIRDNLNSMNIFWE